MHTPRRWPTVLLELLLLVLISTGITFRFFHTDWSQGANLHPDEYGLTNTLTQLSLPATLADYFNTRLSPLSPYNKYDPAGQRIADGPDNRLRWGQWPIILLRAAGELTGQTGYNEIRLLGRQLAALADTLSLFLLLAIGTRLYGHLAGLLATAFSALAVMQIQQSHFMTVDNFAVLFVMLALYAAVRAAASPPVGEAAPGGAYRLRIASLIWYALFGAALGMAVASRVNLVPLAGIIVVAAFLSIADLKLRRPGDMARIALYAALGLVFAAFVSLLVFRVAQPMTFRASSGDTGFFTLRFNPDWWDSMQVAQSESSGVGGGPPAEQWAHRPAILFPLMNIVLWGMGLPLGLAAWGGFLWAAWRSLRWREWRLHLLPLVWVGGYFLFMGTRWVKSVRYFLPIYPLLCLFAAWALIALYRRARPAARAAAPDEAPALAGPSWAGWALPAALLAAVLLGTLAWSFAFVRAVYVQDHTRVQATRWIYQNVPAPVMLSFDTPSGPYNEPLGAPESLVIAPGREYTARFTLPEDGTLRAVSLARAAALDGPGPVALRLTVSTDPGGNELLAETLLPVGPAANGGRPLPWQADFPPTPLEAWREYYLHAAPQSAGAVVLMHAVIANESWDEGLPFPFDGRNPFGDLYRGLTLETRWHDSPDKKAMFLDRLSQADYIILPSQRSIWSAPRIPLTYPMTLEYYRALFDGRLGFELAASFQSPLRLGPLQVSDVGGTLAWGRAPDLPLFNLNPLAAEEAFSIYDHPPVWIFRKRADFNLAHAAAVLDAVDLDTVVVQGPRDADWPQE